MDESLSTIISDESTSKNNSNIKHIQTDSKVATVFLSPSASSSQENFVTITESTTSHFQAEKQTKQKQSTIQAVSMTTLQNYEPSTMLLQPITTMAMLRTLTPKMTFNPSESKTELSKENTIRSTEIKTISISKTSTATKMTLETHETSTMIDTHITSISAPSSPRQDKSFAFSRLDNIKSTKMRFLTTPKPNTVPDIQAKSTNGAQNESTDNRTKKAISIQTLGTSKTAASIEYFLHFTTNGYKQIKNVHGERIKLYKLLKFVRKKTKKQ
jgi:hypothetical protein